METHVMEIASSALIMGLVATAVLDLWAQFLKQFAGVIPTNWAMVGRWFAHLPHGQFQHAAISQAPVVANERILGWFAHYVVGFSYALIFLLLSDEQTMPITWLSAISFGFFTVLAPWLILQPGLGLGYFASNTPNPTATRFLNMLAHMVFGLGLYLAWNLLP